jgi:hypothetical protein
MYDEKIMEEIDDISDTEKVSLISDIELPKENDSTADQETEEQDISKDKLGELNLNLKNISKLNLDQNKNGTSNDVIKRVANGIEISKSKDKCSHKRTCSSCYNLPVDENIINIATQEELITNLSMTHEEKIARRKEQALKANNIQTGGDKEPEDTVSDEEYGTESDADASKSDKKGETDNSKYSHSRFSSQIDAELDELNLNIGEIGHGISPIQ